MLRLAGEQVESLFDEALPIGVRELPADLARLDVLLSDPAMLAPIAESWQRTVLGHGRPTIPMSLFVRLMVIKQRSGCGYETLVREVSDSLHLRRFRGRSLTASDEAGGHRRGRVPRVALRRGVASDVWLADLSGQ